MDTSLDFDYKEYLYLYEIHIFEYKSLNEIDEYIKDKIYDEYENINKITLTDETIDKGKITRSYTMIKENGDKYYLGFYINLWFEFNGDNNNDNQ